MIYKYDFKRLFMNIGDVVVRRSYNKDIKFKVVDIKDEDGSKKFILKGESIRIIADAFADDLEIVKKDMEDSLSKLIKQKINKASQNNRAYKFSYNRNNSFRHSIDENNKNNISDRSLKKKELVLV